MNKVELIGRISQDIDVKTSQAGKSYLNFSVAIDRKYKDQSGNRITDFLNRVVSLDAVVFFVLLIHRLMGISKRVVYWIDPVVVGRQSYLEVVVTAKAVSA